MGNENKILTVVNEDGTSTEDMPKNPLKEKWDRLYPPIPKPEYSQICDGYSCDYCDRCPSGSNWIIPEEDREVWEEYQKELKEYFFKHGNIIHRNKY